MDMRVDHSTALFHGGIRGAIIGAIAGALLAMLATYLLDFVTHSGSGGPGLHFMAGAAVGAFIGWFIGILLYRRTGRGARE
jgi:ABC-type Fe3+-siderophore transport system permease subunit